MFRLMMVALAILLAIGLAPSVGASNCPGYVEPLDECPPVESVEEAPRWTEADKRIRGWSVGRGYRGDCWHDYQVSWSSPNRQPDAYQLRWKVGDKWGKWSRWKNKPSTPRRGAIRVPASPPARIYEGYEFFEVWLSPRLRALPEENVKVGLRAVYNGEKNGPWTEMDVEVSRRPLKDLRDCERSGWRP